MDALTNTTPAAPETNDTREETQQTFTITRDDLRSIIRQAWAAGNESKIVQSNWAKGQGAQEVLRDVLARFEGRSA